MCVPFSSPSSSSDSNNNNKDPAVQTRKAARTLPPHTTRDSLRKETMVRRRPQRVVGVTVAAFAFAFLPVLLLMSVRSRIPEVGEQRSSVGAIAMPIRT